MSSRGDQWAPSLQSQKMSVLLLILLTVVTCGIYTLVWLSQRRPFLNSLDRSEQVSAGMINTVIGCYSVSFILGLAAGITDNDGLDGLSRLFSFVSSITLLVSCFRWKRMFERYLVRSSVGGYQKLSGLATFFFNIYYLQYRINKLSDLSGVADHFD